MILLSSSSSLRLSAALVFSLPGNLLSALSSVLNPRSGSSLVACQTVRNQRTVRVRDRREQVATYHDPLAMPWIYL